jgi:hypothetical protein
MDHEDYYDIMTDVDAHANSLVESPEPQVYLPEVNLIDIVSSGQEIVEPRTHAQAVDPSNKFHKERHSIAKKEVNSLTENNTRTLVPMPLNIRVIGCLWILK